MKKKCMILAGIVAAVVLCTVIVSACFPNSVERVYWEFHLLGKTEEETDAIMGQQGRSFGSGIIRTIYSVSSDREIFVHFNNVSKKADCISGIFQIDEHEEFGWKEISDEFGHSFH
ncbi:MAG: hypothetical protein KH354_05690 [Clostridiales bacterium]|nr:hypothetical protein [Clostridiales bacterium]